MKLLVHTVQPEKNRLPALWATTVFPIQRGRKLSPNKGTLKGKKNMTQLIVKSASAANVRPLIQAALDHEARILKVGIRKTIRRLQEFEQRFGVDSRKFYQDFQAGEMGDDMEYMKWAGEYETLQQLQEDYAEIKEIQVC